MTDLLSIATNLARFLGELFLAILCHPLTVLILALVAANLVMGAIR